MFFRNLLYYPCERVRAILEAQDEVKQEKGQEPSTSLGARAAWRNSRRTGYWAYSKETLLFDDAIS
jgi:hypothetical protein